MPIAETTVTVRHTNGETDTLPAATPIYVESWQRANSARSDDGSMASVEDLVPAGTLASPDYYVGGVDVAEATWYVEDLATGDERICVALDREPTEDDDDEDDDEDDEGKTGWTWSICDPDSGPSTWDEDDQTMHETADAAADAARAAWDDTEEPGPLRIVLQQWDGGIDVAADIRPL